MKNLLEILNSVEILNELAAADFASPVWEAVNENEVEALSLYIRMKGLSLALEKASEAIKGKALKEAEELAGGTKNASYKGCKIQIKEVGSKWHFDKTNDPTFPLLEFEVHQANERIKEREKFLKALKSPMDIVTEDGDVVKIFPAYKTSTTGISVELQKVS